MPTYALDDAGTERESDAVRVETLGDFVHLVLFPTPPHFCDGGRCSPGLELGKDREKKEKR